jgi:hypothetical protein
MSIELLALFEWSASARRDSVVSNPTWQQIGSAIRALNNDNLNDLYLYPSASDSETYLAIGGGAGRYILTGSIKNESFPTLVNSAREPMPYARLVVGGQLGDFPANWVVDLAAALETAKSFVAAGGFLSGTQWTYV